MRIIGPPSAARAAVVTAVQALAGHARFALEMFTPLWSAGLEYGIDPVGVIAQAWKETGGGAYPGQVLPQHYNTCGLKIRHQGMRPGTSGDEPLAHATFASWDVGATAHVQHLCAYAGQPVEGLIVDPRYWLVAGKHGLENWADLGGRWAPSAAYGTEIETLMRRLRGQP